MEREECVSQDDSKLPQPSGWSHWAGTAIDQLLKNSGWILNSHIDERQRTISGCVLEHSFFFSIVLWTPETHRLLYSCSPRLLNALFFLFFSYFPIWQKYDFFFISSPKSFSLEHFPPPLYRRHCMLYVTWWQLLLYSVVVPQTSGEGSLLKSCYEVIIKRKKNYH